MISKREGEEAGTTAAGHTAIAPIVTGNFAVGRDDLQATVHDKFHILSNANKTMLESAAKNAYHD